MTPLTYIYNYFCSKLDVEFKIDGSKFLWVSILVTAIDDAIMQLLNIIELK